MAIVSPHFPTITGTADTIASKRVTFWALFQVAVNTVTFPDPGVAIGNVISAGRTPIWYLRGRSPYILSTGNTPIFKSRGR